MERATARDAPTAPGPGAKGYLMVASWTVGFWLLLSVLGIVAFGALTVGILAVGTVFMQFPVLAAIIAYVIGLILAGRRCRIRGATQWAAAVAVSIVPVIVAAAVLVAALATLGS